MLKNGVDILSSATKSTVGERRRDEVYVGAVPLRAQKGPAQLIMSAAYSANLWDLQHFMVIIKPSSSPLLSQVLVFDFQPQDPENIYIALAALSGKKIPGFVLTRKLPKLPKSKCWFVGQSRLDAVDAANKFNESWQTDLRIGYHDCRNYTNELKPSRVQVVTAHIWKTLIQISQAKHGRLRPSLMSFAMNLRGRIRFNMPENSFGTLVSRTTVRYKADKSSMELDALTGLLRNAITKTSDNYAKARHGDEIYSMLIDYYNEIGGDKPTEVDLCRFTSWCGFPYYEIDFGWGKPSWIATPSKFVEIVFLYDTKCGDGIEAWVTLNEDDMVEFECRYQRKSLGTKALYQERSLRSAM